MYRHFVKRGLDILFSVVGILVLALPMLLIALIIRLDSPGKVMFPQERVTVGKKHFRILKFRSMPLDVPADVPTRDFRWGDRLTPFQRFLRKSSLDELPQLFNILKGDMSFVGPRPVIPQEDDLITERDKYGANDVLPGLTGWAQINGRDELLPPEKAKLDGEYVKKQSFWFDFRCLLGTVPTVFRQKGYAEGTVKASETGTERVPEKCGTVAGTAPTERETEFSR